jgi:hypothetical protein
MLQEEEMCGRTQNAMGRSAANLMRPIRMMKLYNGNDARISGRTLRNRSRVDFAETKSYSVAYCVWCSQMQTESSFLPRKRFCLLLNKKFWEEPIACFPWYDTGHIENDASNNSYIVVCVFVTAVTFLPRRCLATIEGIHRQHTHRQQRDLISQLSFFEIRKIG